MDTKDKVKERIDIVELVGTYVELKKAGRNYKGLCPFHGENTPSFMVSPELQIYKCFGCNKSGDIFSFVQEIEGIDFFTALQQLADKAGVEVQQTYSDPQKQKKDLYYKINEDAAKLFQHFLLKHPSGKVALKYLKDRGVKPSSIKDFNLGFAPDSWSTLYETLSKKYNPTDLSAAGLTIPKRSGQGYIDRFRGRIIFPLVGIQNKVHGFVGRTIVGDDAKYLNTNDTLIFNKSAFIYALDKAKIAVKQLK